MNPGCEEIRSRLLLPGEKGREHVEAHLADCPACRQWDEVYRTAVRLGAAALPAEETASGGWRRRRARGPGRNRWIGAAVLAAGLAAAALTAWAWQDGRAQRNPAAGRGASDAPSAAREDDAPPAGPAVTEAPTMTVAPADGAMSALSGPAFLERPDTGRLSLAPGARVRVASWTKDRTVLWLDEGRLDADVQHRQPDQVFEVRTEFAVVRVVGTRFAVIQQPGTETRIEGFDGEVRVDSPAGTEIARVAAGRSVRVLPAAGAAAVPGVRTEGGPSLPESLAVATARAMPASAGARSPRVVPRPDAGQEGSAPVPDAFEERIRRLLAEGHADDAMALVVARLAEGGPGRAGLLALLGDARRIAGRPAEALDAYREALAAGPASEELLVDIASLQQGALADPVGAAASWGRCLAAYPAGAHASRALFERWTLARQRGDVAEAADDASRLVARWPDSPEAVRVLVDEGRWRMGAGDLEGAAAWFQGACNSTGHGLAEAALVGLMRVRLQQQDATQVRSLAGQYGQRFPDGRRQDEVRRILEAL